MLWDSDKQWRLLTEQPTGETLHNSIIFSGLNGGNGRSPLASGTYKIEVDFQTGKVTLTKQ